MARDQRGLILTLWTRVRVIQGLENEKGFFFFQRQAVLFTPNYTWLQHLHQNITPDQPGRRLASAAPAGRRTIFLHKNVGNGHCSPLQSILDLIAGVPRVPAPLNTLPSKLKSFEGFVHVHWQERFSQTGKLNGIRGIFVFCGFHRKGTTSHFSVRLTNESEGQTVCAACEKVPQVISEFHIEKRARGSEQTAAVVSLQDAMASDSSPQSSQNSSCSKRTRSLVERDLPQPSIIPA